MDRAFVNMVVTRSGSTMYYEGSIFGKLTGSMDIVVLAKQKKYYLCLQVLHSYEYNMNVYGSTVISPEIAVITDPLTYTTVYKLSTDYSSSMSKDEMKLEKLKYKLNKINWYV